MPLRLKISFNLRLVSTLAKMGWANGLPFFLRQAISVSPMGDRAIDTSTVPVDAGGQEG
jgi:hypothetical protein